MELDLDNEIQFKEFLYQVFTTYDIMQLQNISSQLNTDISLCKTNSQFIRAGRLINLIEAYIEILNKDLSKLN